MLDNAPVQPSLKTNGAGATCTYCKRILLPSPNASSDREATRDHVWPLAGNHLPADYKGPLRVWCCFRCNHLKGDLTPDQWAAVMAATPHWWTTPSLQRYRHIYKRYYTDDAQPCIRDLTMIASIAFWRRVIDMSTQGSVDASTRQIPQTR